MKILNAFLVLLLIAAPHAFAFGKKPKPAPAAASEKKYACPMFCVASARPGKCPKCGMEMGELSY